MVVFEKSYNEIRFQYYTECSSTYGTGEFLSPCETPMLVPRIVSPEKLSIPMIVPRIVPSS